MNEILKIPFAAFNNNWDDLQLFLKHRGNPPYEITDDLDLRYSDIKTLGNLTSVGGSLYLFRSKIESLGNLTSVEGDLNLIETLSIKTLGNLTSVGGNLDLRRSEIEDLGKLKYVGGDLNLRYTSLLKKYTKEEIRSMVEIVGNIIYNPI
jgi:hypothetical protein